MLSWAQSFRSWWVQGDRYARSPCSYTGHVCYLETDARFPKSWQCLVSTKRGKLLYCTQLNGSFTKILWPVSYFPIQRHTVHPRSPALTVCDFFLWLILKVRWSIVDLLQPNNLKNGSVRNLRWFMWGCYVELYRMFLDDCRNACQKTVVIDWTSSLRHAPSHL